MNIVKMADRHAKMRAGEEEYMQECLLAEIQLESGVSEAAMRVIEVTKEKNDE
jgi:hypothetical protein